MLDPCAEQEMQVTRRLSPWPVLGAEASAIYSWLCAGGSIISAQNRGNPGWEGLDGQPELVQGPQNQVPPGHTDPPSCCPPG